MAAATTDQLIIKIEVDNERAITAVDEVLAKLSSLDRAASKESLKNFVNLGTSLERLAHASEILSKVDFRGVQGLLKGLENIDAAKMSGGVDAAATSMKKLGDSMKGIEPTAASGLVAASIGISKLANALVRFSAYDYTSSVENVRKILLRLAPAVQQAGKYGTPLNNMRLAIENLGPALRSFGKAESYEEAFKNISITIGEIVKAIAPLSNAPVQQLKILSDAIKKLGAVGADNALASNMAHLAKGIVTLVTVLSYGIKDSVAERFSKFADTILPPLKSLSNVLGQFTKMGVDENLGAKLSSAAHGLVILINTLTAGVSPERAAKFGELTGALSGALKPLSSALVQLQKLGSDPALGANLASSARGIVSFVATFAAGMTEGLLTQFTKAANAIAPAFRAMASGLRNISKIGADEGFVASMKVAQQSLVSFVNEINTSLSEDAVNRFARLARSIRDVGDALRRINTGSARRISEAVPTHPMIARLNIFARRLTGVKTNFKTAGDAGKAFGRKLLGIPFASGAKAIKGLAHHISVLKGRIGRVVLLRMIRSAMAKVTAAIREGTNALYQWASAYGNSFKTTMDSLATSFLYLRNSMAAATSPLVDALAPAINHVIDLLVNALNIFNQFIAAITGASTWRKAIKKSVSYGQSLDDVGGSANGAGSAMKEFEKQLMGFDEINNLTLPKDNGGRGGGGSAGEDFAGMFEEMDISSNVADWVNDLKNAWENNDWSFFEDVGRQIGEKIITGLQNINWDAIQEVAEKLGTAIASTLNGILEAEIDGVGIGEAIGNAFAEAYNTWWSFLDGFFDTFNFELLGERVIQGIVGFFETLDWDKYSSTLSHMFTALLDTLSGLLKGVDWSEIPTLIFKQIAEFFKGVDVADIASSIAQLITSALIAAVKLITGFAYLALNIVNSIGEYIQSRIDDGPFDSLGANIIYGIWAGITDAIAGAAVWLRDNIFAPIFNGIKSAFGISSPATTMYDVGKQIIAGIWEGLKQAVVDVLNWFADLPGKIKEKLNVGEDFWSNLVSIGGLLESKVVDLEINVTGTVKKGVDKILEFWNKIKSGAKKTLTLTTNKKGNMTSKVIKTIQTYWAKLIKLKKSFKLTLYSKGITAKLGNAIEKIRSAWAGIREGTKKITLSFADKFKSAWSSLKTWLRSNAPGWILNLVGLSHGGIFKGAHWHPVTTAATGGAFSSGQMFIAREAGPELVGTIGGNTAVMNNDQIVASVSDGVYRAVVAAIGGSGGDIVIKVDNTVLGRAAINGINSVTRQQGRLMLDLG